MLTLFRNIKSGAFGLLILAVGACSATYQNHGYVPSDSELEEIIVGIDTRETVGETIGRPTSFGVLESGGWYYTQSRWRHYAFKAPKVVDRQLLAITYTDAGIVENIERFTLEDGRVVPLSRRVTDSNIKGITFLRQLLGNIGNLQPGQLLGE